MEIEFHGNSPKKAKSSTRIKSGIFKNYFENSIDLFLFTNC